MSESLEQLYQQAQSAIKARDYDRAVGLLKQILVIDENYKDTSRLLAQMVRLRRRRWRSTRIKQLMLFPGGIFISERTVRIAAMTSKTCCIAASRSSSIQSPVETGQGARVT